MAKKYSGDVISQIRKLRMEEKLPVAEVVERMKDSNVTAAAVYHFCAVNKRAQSVQPKKAKSTKKAAPKIKAAAPAVETADTLHGLVDQLVEECAAYTAFAFARARREIVKHIAETRAKRVELGEEVPLLDTEGVA